MGQRSCVSFTGATLNPLRTGHSFNGGDNTGALLLNAARAKVFFKTIHDTLRVGARVPGLTIIHLDKWMDLPDIPRQGFFFYGQIAATLGHLLPPLATAWPLCWFFFNTPYYRPYLYYG